MCVANMLGSLSTSVILSLILGSVRQVTKKGNLFYISTYSLKNVMYLHYISQKILLNLST